MHWIEICTDGSYVHQGREYPLLSEGIVECESRSGERLENEWERVIIPFEIETDHGIFAWEVEIIEYLELGVASLLGSRISASPDSVYLKDEVMFRIQDGWITSEHQTLDMKPRMTKMRLV